MTGQRMYMLNNTRGSHEKTDEMTANDDEELSCRICMEPGPRSDFIAPCACRGSSKWVHRECLDKWRATREDRAFSRCTECLAAYKLVARSADTFKTQCLRRTKFGCFVFRDLSLSFAAVQLVIGLMAWLVATTEKGRLVNYFHAGAWPTLFYYCCGLVVFLSTLGLMFFCGVGHGNPMLRNDCCILNYYCCDECCFLVRHNPACCVCTHECCVCGDACVCCEASSLSAELVPVLLFIVVVLAVVGAFVAIFAGAVFLNQIVQSHVHMLQKKGLAHDYIVADLAAADIAGGGGGGDGSEKQRDFAGPIAEGDIDLESGGGLIRDQPSAPSSSSGGPSLTRRPAGHSSTTTAIAPAASSAAAVVVTGGAPTDRDRDSYQLANERLLGLGIVSDDSDSDDGDGEGERRPSDDAAAHLTPAQRKELARLGLL